MPLLTRFWDSALARISRRLETKASRFGLAVSTGFIVAFVGFATTGLDRTSFAYDMFELFGSGLSQQQQQPQIFAGSRDSLSPELRRHHVARRRSGEIALARTNGEGRPVSLSRRSVCVRLCDGYTFPVGDYHGDADRASHEATCHSECPGAETALYILPSGADTMDAAERVDSHEAYSQLPDAFHYSTVLDDSCTCHPAAGNRIQSLLHDFTLRRGDAVMTRSGFKVFHGGQFPFRRRDFVALARSRDIRKVDRAAFKAIERASLPGLTNVAQRPTPSVVDSRNGTKQLQHQASR